MSTDRPDVPDSSAEVWEALDGIAPEPLSDEARSRIGRALGLAMEVPSSRRGGAMYSRNGLAAAAVVALIVGGAAGFGIGTTRAPVTSDGTTTAASSPTAQTPIHEETTTMDGNQYLLLIRDTEAVGQAIEEHGIDAIVEEYGGWAGSLAQEGRLVAAEKLTDAPRWVGDAAPSSSNISGFFLITAASEAEALEIARQSPHARYGGVLEVREVDPTEG